MSDDLNCSDGAKMLIERMKTHPEEFRGGGARWAVAVNQMLQVRRGGTENNLMMSRRDMNALWDAFERHVMEPALAEYAVTEMMEPKAEKHPAKKLLVPANMRSEMFRLMEESYKREYYEAEQKLRYNSLGRYDLP